MSIRLHEFVKYLNEDFFFEISYFTIYKRAFADFKSVSLRDHDWSDGGRDH